MGRTTHCLIVDDEPLAIEVIETYLNRLDGYNIIGKCRNPVEAFSLLQRNPIDLLFLDIQMPELTGLDLLKTLRNPPLVILTTAHREYALEGYELDVLDYLLKPISFDRFLQAIDKYQQRETAQNLPINSYQEHIGNKEFIDIRADRKTYRIPLQGIIYIESMKDYLQIFTSQKKFITKSTLQDFLDQLPVNQFVQIHRSYIVSMSHITAFDNTMVEVGKRQLPVGRSFNRQVKEVLTKLGNR